MKRCGLIATAILITQLLISTNALALPRNNTYAEPKQWSVGLQLGNLLNTGVSAQRLDIGGGALDLSLGLFFGTLSLAADYIWLFPDRSDSNPTSYNDLRGKWTPFAGLGAQIGWGLGIRGLGGVQYTMQEQPFNFYGALMLIVGPAAQMWGANAGIGLILGARMQI